MNLASERSPATISFSPPPGQARSSRKVPGGARIRTSFGYACIFSSARDIPGEYWESALADAVKDSRYHEIATETLQGQFDHRYIVLWNEREEKAAVQPVFFVDQDILEGLPEKVHAALAWPRRFWSRWLRLRMLVAGCSAGEGEPGSTEPWAVKALCETLLACGKISRASLLLLKDFPSEYREALKFFSQHDYIRVPSMPACALDIDFASFEEFVSTKLGRTFRESLRRKLRKSGRQAPVTLEVITDPTPVIAEICALYQQTYERSKMRFERLTEEFFLQVGRRMPDRARFFIWRCNGRISAFALCLEHDGSLHHLNVGFDYSVALDLHLYYVVMRDLIQWCLDHGLKRYVTGQLNYDPKFHFRMKLVPLDLYARHTSPLLNHFFKLALPFLQPARHEPILRQFPNFSEL